MKKMSGYAENLKNFVRPYANAAGDYVQESADMLQGTYRKNRRRLEKKVRWLRIKNTFDRMVYLSLIVALLISIVCMLVELFKNQNEK